MTGPAAGAVAVESDLAREIEAAVMARQGRRVGAEIKFLCPAHNDHNPSAAWNPEKQVWTCYACQAGGGARDLAQRLDLADNNRRESWTRSRGSGNSQTITLEALAADKALPADFLRGLGLHDLPNGRGVAIPYQDDAGNVVHVKRRTALKAKEGSRWPAKTPLMVYGRGRLEEARRAGYAVLPEGESDCWTLWHHGFPALGIPGAEAAGTLEPAHLDGIGRLYVIQEPDGGGASFAAGIARRLREIGWQGQAFVIRLADAKDPNDLHKQNPDGFRAAFQAAINGAEPLHQEEPQSAEIMETAPEMIRRPLCLVGGRAYAATWPWVKRTIRQTTDGKGKITVHDPPLTLEEQAPAIVRDDGVLFTDAPLLSARPLSALGLAVILPEIPPGDRTWSGAGVKRYQAGERPDPADVFHQVRDVVDRFMDFKRSLTDQGTMCELVGCFVFATYLLDAFNVAPYLWPNGDRGAGKTNLLFTVTELSYLGAVILAGGSYASLRDLADYGATIAFDDCENVMDPKKSDPDKRTLLLAGNRRGATVTFKEPAGKRGWVTRRVHTFCPRLFSAIRLPDPVLASRTITVPLVRSGDDRRAKATPLDHAAWPHDRRRLVDDLWAIALKNLPAIRRFDEEAARRVKLTGRDLEPWRAILGVALWLQEAHGVAGLFERMEALSVTYQTERGEIEATDPTRLLVLALWDMIDKQGVSAFEFETSALVGRINRLARETEITNDGEDFTNPKRVGRLLKRLRFEKAPPGKTRRKWRTTCADIESLARSYGMALSQEQNAENAGNAETPTGEQEEDSAFLQDRHYLRFIPDIPPPGDNDAPLDDAAEEVADPCLEF